MLIKFFIYISLTRICIVLGQNLGISLIYPVPSYEKYVGWGGRTLIKNLKLSHFQSLKPVATGTKIAKSSNAQKKCMVFLVAALSQ